MLLAAVPASPHIGTACAPAMLLGLRDLQPPHPDPGRFRAKIAPAAQFRLSPTKKIANFKGFSTSKRPPFDGA